MDACADTDHDGVGDLGDIDMDNDGIVNWTESPGCFYTAGELESGDRSGFVGVGTGFNMVSPYGAPGELVDGDAAAGQAGYAVRFAGSQSITPGSDIYTFEFAVPVRLENIYLRYVDGNSHFINGAKAKLQGSLDGEAWTDLNAGSTYNQANSSGVVLGQGQMRYHLFPVTQSASRYKYYRIAGVSGSLWNGGYSNEVYFETPGDFIPSANPKPVCSGDPDGDGIFNHLDLDSDGDSCPDVYEAGVPGATKGTGDYTDNVVVDPATPTEGVGVNGYRDALETSPDSGVPDFSPGYHYAVDPSMTPVPIPTMTAWGTWAISTWTMTAL